MKKILGVLFCLTAVLLMISSGTAVPVSTSEPVMDIVEKQEQAQELFESVVGIFESEDSFQEKRSQLESLLDLDDYMLSLLIIVLLYSLLFINPALFFSISLYMFLFGFRLHFRSVQNDPTTPVFLDIISSILYGFMVASFWPWLIMMALSVRPFLKTAFQ